MSTKRTPIGRPPKSRITPEAVQAFRDGNFLVLHRLLGLKPWEISPLNAVGTSPYPRGTNGAESWPQALALRAELSKALAEADNE